MPALRVDRCGARLGRGGGWYDRALAWRRSGVPLVAVCWPWEFTRRTGAGARARRAGERGAHSGAARGAVSGATGQWRRAARGAEYRLGQAGIRI
ncbi:5-formyltetrahydrofolate cyclo-ligase [Bifidobacterium pseudolongum]|uniref:5-formyltetrahydrofolate cyclo-ligase n=1 Tax=Bifidobacterium pseudolongum TaxID=1694 RepID=UPI003B75B5AA